MVDTGPTLVSVESVREKLLASVNQTWQQDVEQQLSREHDGYQSYDDEHKFTLFLKYVLHTDMRHYWNAGREQPWFVQVEQVEDISQPVKRRLCKYTEDGGRGRSRRMLKMVLFDGKKHHLGIEHAALGFDWPRLGSKLVLDSSLMVRNGILMLTPLNCGFLGGSVREFEEHQKRMDVVVQEPLYGRRGPPLKLDEYKKNLKEKMDRLEQPSRHQTENRDHVSTAPAAPAPAPAPAENVYIIPSESDDDFDIEDILENKRTRTEVSLVDDEEERQEEDLPRVQLNHEMTSALREVKRRKEMRERELNKTLQ